MAAYEPCKNFKIFLFLGCLQASQGVGMSFDEGTCDFRWRNGEIELACKEEHMEEERREFRPWEIR